MILKMRHQSREKLNDLLGDLGERGITQSAGRLAFPFYCEERQKISPPPQWCRAEGDDPKGANDQFGFIDMEIPISLDV